MAKLTIRPATADDIATMAELKSTYVRSLYRGFISQDILHRSTPDFHAATLRAWLESGMYRILLAECDGVLSHYIVFGTNPEEPHNGLIYEGVSSSFTSTEDKRLLVDRCLQELREMGHTIAHLWILTDNFRVRFLFENLGFRPDGAREKRNMFGQELHIARYQYKLK